MNAPFLAHELVVDSFAGGGGASEGIRAALGRDPDIAINHDRAALAMHRMNHPGTHHVAEDVVTVDSRALCGGRPIGMLWMSPDCKHHSKAKGGKPRDKAIRGLAWTVLGWVNRLPKRQRPRVVFLENVEEFADWGPLLEDGRPCPVQRGATFRSYVGAWQALGYVVDHRELRACDYGVPTIRKRLYWIARRDGLPIVWPAPTHGAPTHPDVIAGRLKPWVAAATIIDWALPCPSIFDSSAEIKARYGVRAIRPLAEATMARIAKGTMRYVVNAAKPFIVQVNHGGGVGGRDHAVDEPAPTMTGGRGEALVTPFVSYGQQGGGNRDAADPLHTITASAKDQNAIVAPLLVTNTTGHTGGSATKPLSTLTTGSQQILVTPFVAGLAHGDSGGRRAYAAEEPLTTIHAGGSNHAIVTPFVTKFNTGSVGRGMDEPLNTITSHASETHGGGAAPLGVVAPYLVPRYGERPGQEPRTRSIEDPAPVVVPTGNEGSIAAVHLQTMRNAQKPFAGADEPTHTMTAGGANAFVVAAFLAQHNTDRNDGIKPGRSVEEPISTVTAAGGQSTLVAAHMFNMRGSDRRDGSIEAPTPTLSAQGQHAAVVAAFLAKYYGAGEPVQAADVPLHTITAKPRHGLVTVTIAGEPFVIVDIGMRMLTPRERFSAQGFRPDYIIDTGREEDGSTIAFTLEQQGRFCGNSVCPEMARVLVAANYALRQAIDDPRASSPIPLFEAAE